MAGAHRCRLPCIAVSLKRHRAHAAWDVNHIPSNQYGQCIMLCQPTGPNLCYFWLEHPAAESAYTTSALSKNGFLLSLFRLRDDRGKKQTDIRGSTCNWRDGKRNSLPRILLCGTQGNLSRPGVVAGGDETKVQTLCVKCGFFRPPRGLECVRIKKRPCFSTLMEDTFSSRVRSLWISRTSTERGD